MLGCLLPKSSDPEIDLEMYEALLGFDLEGLARRAVDAGTVKPKDILAAVTINDPGIYFTIQEKWRRDISINDKVALVRSFLATLQTYEERVIYCKRSEEVDQEFLLAPVWQRINEHYSHLGINASTLPELIEQLGLLRYGHKPKVGDVFAGGGSIPFEAARLGCDAFASDLNPVACMLNWGGINIVGVSPEQRQKIIAAQQTVVDLVENNLARLGIEHDSRGNRAKAYLYCIEARCPETGWLVPLIPSLVISKSRNVRAILIPDPAKKRFKIELQTGVGAQEMKDAEKGTVRDGCMVYCLDGKTYTTSIKTLRGDYRLPSGENGNRLRSWELNDVTPRTDDVFQERLYAIQWITKETLNKARQETFFAAVTAEDIEREDVVEALVSSNLAVWQASGLVPDMAIEPGYNTTQPMRERGWSYWHHLFCARQILVGKLVKEALQTLPADMQCVLSLSLAKMMDWSSKLCRYGTGAARESIAQTFYNQAFNTNFSYGVRSFVTGKNYLFLTDSISEVHGRVQIENIPASQIDVVCDIWVTDPPYADAVNYHEIAEFFIAWLRKNPPAPFDQWKWDSRRALAITGDGDDFRRGMIEAYAAMAKKMPDNGMQCVLFTHQDTGVWADMVGIFWAAGLQVVAAWYLATEISTELKKGGYVQGTVTLMLKKRPAGDNPGFKQRILPAVRVEVKTQIEQMMHLNEEARNRMGEPVFNDADLQMAGYAAALKVLTAYTQIGDTDVTSLALRPRVRGEVTVVDEIVQQASEAANSLLVPEGLSHDTWQLLGGIQRFYLRMLDMESVGISKLDNYQNFAKAFRVEDYTKVMESMAANAACLKQPNEFASRDLTDSTEIGPSWLGTLVVGIQQILKEVELNAVVLQLIEDIPEFLDVRPKLIDIARFLAVKARDAVVRNAAEVLADRMQNQRALGQD